ncbi:DHH family phosphoesterase [Halopenitus sp. H-Gu1]|uniref:DHH family phosphoesterase n=1 Tax=Halopenitus sp. H-Gu1 TaxID=3242697 RepID=UPI00359E851C
MDDELIDDGSIPLSRRTRLPGKGFFYPDSLDDDRAERRTREAVEGADAVVIADSDADGLACVAMIRERYDAALDVASFEADIEDRLPDDLTDSDAGADSTSDRADDSADESPEDTPGSDDGDGAHEDTSNSDDTDDPHGRSSVALVAAGPYSLDTAFERVAEYADSGIDLYVCDLCPDEFEWIEAPLVDLLEISETARWFDHHQWDDAALEAVRGAGVDLVVGDSEEECTADVALRSLDHDFADRWQELAAVTRDHDLWLKEDSRSDDLADYAYWTSPEEYVTMVGSYGADLPEPVGHFLEHRRVEKQNRIEAAVERATFHAVGGWSVAVTYGRCSQNEVAETLREQGADAAVIVKPAGSASIRGSEDFERAHEVARRVNGGGHPKAAGCKPDIYDDMLDYAYHWTTEGQAARKLIVNAFEAVAEEAAAPDDAGSDGSETEDAA